ncbi:psp operon transcriptional activator [Desulfobacula phenolica]|uniref:Psp operon transcriptional activator n=1 Tax=Desulfobacula phenolica TaxID=90732 RepID=A0A1H2JEJ6_9BACT|nr:phage shock protein operon transcriptional activator [Desulfobacula toluolica]SDU54832.1 psp operon transcriptional activator [Desulfobacula phenolica]
MSSRNQRRDKDLSMPEALGQSESFIEFQEQISRVAPVERPVLILGERGTGKELAALRLHFLSKRWQKPFVTLNCAALTRTLIESELFGYEKGSFTGAASRRTGRFENASEGTLFLDEIGTVPMEVQEKILRVVEYGSFERVGSSQSIHVDVRIVAATNANLPLMAQSNEFKQDLLDRLSFEVIYVPPLRHRQEDILLLSNHFAARMAFELGRDEIPKICSTALKQLEAYPWPGNIRELKNVIERAVYRSSGFEIKDICFNPFHSPYKDALENTGVQKDMGKKSGILSTKDKASKDEVFLEEASVLDKILKKPFKAAIGELECYLVSRALEACRFNQKKAAKMLGLSYDQFRGILKKHTGRI